MYVYNYVKGAIDQSIVFLYAYHVGKFKCIKAFIFTPILTLNIESKHAVTIVGIIPLYLYKEA